MQHVTGVQGITVLLDQIWHMFTALRLTFMRNWFIYHISGFQSFYLCVPFLMVFILGRFGKKILWKFESSNWMPLTGIIFNIDCHCRLDHIWYHIHDRLGLQTLVWNMYEITGESPVVNNKFVCIDKWGISHGMLQCGRCWNVHH